MTVDWLLGVGILLLASLLAAWILARLRRSSDEEDQTISNPGPTGDRYPPGSRPGGPGAESQRPDGRSHPG